MIALFRQFALGQSSLQILQAVNGLLLVWLLSIPDFAVYAVFTGAMGFASQIIGFGLGPTLASCVGSRFEEPEVVGRYLRAALALRMWVLPIVCPIGIGLLWYSGHKAAAPAIDLLLLALCLLVANYLAAQTDLYKSPLQMNRKLGGIFRWTVTAEAIRLPLFGLAYFGGFLSALTAGMITVVGLVVNFYGVRREGRALFVMPTDPCRTERRELLHLTVPTIPNVIFGAFQGQIVIFMAALFGSTGQMAAVGALVRLSRLLGFLSAANGMVVGPAVARLNPTAFWERMPLILGIAAVIATGLAASGFLFPETLVLVLGGKYQALTGVVWLVTLNAGLTYLVGVVGTLRSFRRWVAWWASFATIGAVLIAQGIVIALAPLDTLLGMLLLGTAANTARMLMLFLTMATARYKPQWLRSTKAISASAPAQV